MDPNCEESLFALALRRLGRSEVATALADANPKIVSQIATVGIPLLQEKGGVLQLTRGPRLNIPPTPPDGTRG